MLIPFRRKTGLSCTCTEEAESESKGHGGELDSQRRLSGIKTHPERDEDLSASHCHPDSLTILNSFGKIPEIKTISFAASHVCICLLHVF